VDGEKGTEQGHSKGRIRLTIKCGLGKSLARESCVRKGGLYCPARGVRGIETGKLLTRRTKEGMIGLRMVGKIKKLSRISRGRDKAHKKKGEGGGEHIEMAGLENPFFH